MSVDDRPVFDLRLDSQLCFALYSASRAVTATYRPLLAKLGLTYPQYLAMLALWESDGLTVGELGRRLRLDSGTLSPMIARLEQADFVSRERRTDDERSVRVVLTAEGRELRTRVTDLPCTMVAATGLDVETLAELRKAVNVLVDNLSDDDH